jgi:ATP-binding protein involved in chromosome partitioning
MPKPQQILEELKKVKYPGLGRDIVSFGIIRDVQVGSAGVRVILAPTTTREDVVAQIRREVNETVSRVADGAPVEIEVIAPEQPQRRATSGPTDIPGVKHVVAVASGKGGVGKSTVAANLALALSAQGHRVGLLDCDVYGPSIALMFGLKERPKSTEDKRIIPAEKFGIRVISFGSFLEDHTPVIWRGPMINKLLTQFLREVEWGELDYLLLDLPPGTGDAQLTITQQIALAGGVIVTTPQDVALLDVKRGVTMFEQVHAPVLGVVENMSFHTCSGCGERYELFGHGGGERVANEFGVPFLGSLPLVRDIGEAADAGTPIVAAQAEHPQSQAFLDIARKVVAAAEAGSREALPTIQ